MKKFFHRFAGGERSGVDGLSRRREEGAMPEKVDVQGNASPHREKSVAGDRVKALAARYETLTGLDSKPHRPESQPTSSHKAPSTRFPSMQSTKGHKQRSPLLFTDKALPPMDPTLQRVTSSSSSADFHHVANEEDHHFDVPPHSPSPAQKGFDHSHNPLQPPRRASRSSKDGRDVSGSSSGSGGEATSGVQSVSKSVAFAPSPKKPVRPSSPPMLVVASPDAAMGDFQQIVGSSSSIGNFAKATLASTARARNSAKQGSTELCPSLSSTMLPPQSHANSGLPTSRPSSSLSTSRPQARRSNSSSNNPGRRSAGNWGGAGESGVLNISQPNLTATHSTGLSTSATGYAMSSSLSLTHGAGDAYSHLPNSIPFVSIPGNAHLRSASPQSIGTTTNSSIHNQIRSNMGSRRGSWNSKVNSTGSVNQGWASSGAKSVGGPSWSEMTQDDLVANLGARERTRQEVLWEIVASEERYVKDLERTKELYLDALLHPMRYSSSTGANAHHDAAGMRPRNSISLESNAELPIAARFMGADVGGGEAAAAAQGQRAREVVEDRGRSGAAASRQASMDSHHAAAAAVPNTAREARAASTKTSNPKRWSNSRMSSRNEGPFSSQTGYGISEGSGLSVPLPNSLRVTLEAVLNGMLEGHYLLSEALKQRYEEQWPLVRSLADVFTRFSYVLSCYKDYVVHLERALDSLEEAALMERAMRGKRLKKEKLTMTVGLGRAVASLEAAAQERGECSLAIFLAMPFQRLLKYPLLFQNLLFHTDASTYEFESTVKMVVDVEGIVRTIEDEKADKEERDRTIDAFARIDGIKDKALLRPKRDRLVIEERALYEENPRRAISESNEGGAEGAMGKGNPTLLSQNAASSSGTLRAALKSKRSYRRLSDFLSTDDRQSQSTKAPNMGSKRDIWLVRFSDVELKCQRVGVTALPMVSSVVLQQSSMRTGGGHEEGEEEGATALSEEEAKIKEEFKRTRESKERMKALRNTTLRSKTRNLYKFLSVTSWKQVHKDRGQDDDLLVDGLTSPQEVDEEGEDEEEMDEDDDKSSSASQETDGGVLDSERYVRQSKLSFSYWGNDKVEPKPLSTRSQSQLVHAAVNPAFRSRETGHLQKRHSLTPTGQAPQQNSSSSTTKVVASNSHAKARVDKFGSRLRQQQGSANELLGLSAGSATRASSYRGQVGSKTSIVAGAGGGGAAAAAGDAPLASQQSRPSQEMTQQTDLQVRSRSQPYNMQHRPSFVRDESIDSNLKLVSSLIDAGDGGVWR